VVIVNCQLKNLQYRLTLNIEWVVLVTEGMLVESSHHHHHHHHHHHGFFKAMPGVVTFLEYGF